MGNLCFFLTLGVGRKRDPVFEGTFTFLPL